MEGLRKCSGSGRATLTSGVGGNRSGARIQSQPKNRFGCFHKEGENVGEGAGGGGEEGRGGGWLPWWEFF